MKVVINRCFGGFGLSMDALKRYVELKGMTPYFYKENWKTKTYYKIDRNNIDEKDFYIINCIVEDLGNEISRKDFWDFIKNNKDKYIYDMNIPRNDKYLIKAIEEVGLEESSGNCASLKIIEIPDGIEWEIDDYDGMESIEEIHRSWY